MSVIIFSTACSKAIPNKKISKQDVAFSMGTAVTTTLYGSDEDVLTNELSNVSQCLEDVDRDLSWRIDESITKNFNDEHEAAVLNREDVYQTALDIAEASHGAFDPTVFSISQLWHIGDEGQRHPADEEIQEAIQNVDFSKVTLQDGILKTEDPNVKLELGAVGKGYAVDQAYQCLDRETVTAGIISAGSSILTFGEKPDGSLFRVGLRDPRGAQEDLIGIFELTDLAISTSGDYEKYFEEDGKRYHHILDARTGYPADSNLMSVTVIGKNGAECDALSTAGFILGLDEGMNLMNNYEVLAIFVDKQRNVYYNNESILKMLSFDGESKGYKLMAYNQ